MTQNMQREYRNEGGVGKLKPKERAEMKIRGKKK